MSDPSQPGTAIRFSRRQGLTALAVLGPVGLFTACSSGAAPTESTAAPSPATVSSAVAAQERELVALYDAVIAAHPELASALQVIADQHREHAVALEDGGDEAATASVSPAPAEAQAALATLIAAERRAMRQRVDACVEADAPGLARTLAYIAASEGSHVAALRDVRA